MKKLTAVFLALLLIGTAVMSGCTPKSTAGDDTTPESVTEAPTKPLTPESVTEAPTKPLTPDEVTAATVAAAIEKTFAADLQRYSFELKLDGTLVTPYFNGHADGKMVGDYRYETGADKFAYSKVTSGMLMPDSTTYSYTHDSNIVTAVLSKEGTLLDARVENSDGKAPLTTASPFVAVIKALDANNLKDLKQTSGQYGWTARMVLASDSPLMQKLFDQIEGLGTLMAFGKVGMSNPDGGIALSFNLNPDGTLTDFSMSFDIVFAASDANGVVLTLTYTQKAASGDVMIKVPDNLIFDKQAIISELAAVTGAFDGLKQDEAYSIKLEAKNEFDPGWKKLAIVDKLTSTLYKNGTVFNNSFTFKSHTEEDGKESYKYTIGTLKDGSIWMLSRKGSNKASEAPQYSTDERFAYLTDPIVPDAGEVKCLVKKVSGNTTVYDLFFTDAAALTLVDKVTAYVNSNPAEGIIPVDNHIDKNAFTVSASSVTFELEGGRPANAKCDLRLQFVPVAGEYRGQSVTLDAKLDMSINGKLKDAQKYEAPKKADSTLGVGGFDFID